MRGLRTEEGTKFERFFAIVQSEAKKNGNIFFLDCGEGRDFTTSDMEGEDLSGWLIPEKDEEEFTPLFESGNIPADWDEMFVFCIWEKRDGEIAVEFKKY